MAIRNKTITNAKTGHQIKFLQTAKDTGGKLLEMESTFSAKTKEPPPHYHPVQSEVFAIISGELTVRIDGEVKTFIAGDTLHIPAKKVHSMWNNANIKTVVNWKVQPALESEHFFETVMGLSNDGKTNSEGMPGLLQLALMIPRYHGMFRLTSPPFYIQQLVFGVLTPFAYLLGYRPVYKKYLD